MDMVLGPAWRRVQQQQQQPWQQQDPWLLPKIGKVKLDTYTRLLWRHEICSRTSTAAAGWLWLQHPQGVSEGVLHGRSMHKDCLEACSESSILSCCLRVVIRRAVGATGRDWRLEAPAPGHTAPRLLQCSPNFPRRCRAAWADCRSLSLIQ
jgi:hypothetical protein